MAIRGYQRKPTMKERLREADARAQLYLARDRMNAHVPVKAKDQLHRHIHERLIALKLEYPQLWPAKYVAAFDELPASEKRCLACWTPQQNTKMPTSPYQFDRLRTRVVIWICGRCVELWHPLPAPVG